MSPPLISPAMPAAIEHDDSVAKADQLGQFGRAEQNDAPVGGNPADQGIDFALGADVDAARRVVQQNHPRRDLEPFADHDLLLVAARELRWPGRQASAVLMRRRSICRSARSSAVP